MPDSFLSYPAATAHSLSKDPSDRAYKIFGGAQVMDFLAVEAGYADFGSFGATRTVTAPAGIAGTVTSTGKTSGIYADAIASYPINSTFSVFGKLGYGYYWTSVNNSQTGLSNFAAGTPASQKVVGKGVQFGLGVQFNVSKHVAVRAGWQRMPSVYSAGTEKLNIDNTSVGLLYKF